MQEPLVPTQQRLSLGDESLARGKSRTVQWPPRTEPGPMFRASSLAVCRVGGEPRGQTLLTRASTKESAAGPVPRSEGLSRLT